MKLENFIFNYYNFIIQTDYILYLYIYNISSIASLYFICFVSLTMNNLWWFIIVVV